MSDEDTKRAALVMLFCKNKLNMSFEQAAFYLVSVGMSMAEMRADEDGGWLLEECERRRLGEYRQDAS